ncbi:unnamed protein product, partial [Mycena citricolor]
ANPSSGLCLELLVLAGRERGGCRASWLRLGFPGVYPCAIRSMPSVCISHVCKISCRCSLGCMHSCFTLGTLLPVAYSEKETLARRDARSSFLHLAVR